MAYSQHWFCNNCLENALPFHHLDDYGEFQAAVVENICEASDMFKDIDKMIFNPFEINDNIETPMTDIDPDFHFYTEAQYIENTQCDYYLKDKFI